MSSNIEVKLDVLNQKASPALYAAPLADRPAASFTGRLFVDSNSPSTGLYRDTGTAWVQIADAGAGTTGTLQQVTTNGNTTSIGISVTANGIGIGTTIPATNRLDIHAASGIQATFNGTGTTNAALQLQSAGVGKWTIQNNYNSAANDFVITNVLTSENTITIDNTNNLTSIGSFQSNKGTSPSGVSQFVLKTTSGAVRSAIGLIGTDGTNTGSGTFLYNYLDNGTAIPVFQTTRATGNIDFSFSGSFGGKLTVTSGTGDNQIQIVGANAPSLRIDNLGTGATKRAGLGISTATNNFIQGSADRDFCIFNGSTTAASPILFGVYDAGTTNVQEAARISAARSLILGYTGTDTGNRFQVFGTSYTTNSITTYKAGGLTYRSYYGSGNNRSIDFNIDTGNGDAHLTWNTTYNGGWQYFINNYAAKISSADGIFFSVAANGTSGNTITWIDALKITSTGSATFKNSLTIGDTTLANAFTTTYQNSSNGYQFGINSTCTLFTFINGGAATVATVNGATGVYLALSNVNVKKDFEPSTLGLNAILGLKPTLFRMKSENDTEKHLGLIAQEVKEFIPQAYEENDSMIGLNYQAITATLIKAIQELNDKVNALKN